jgi:hypothetical protein
MVGQSGSPRQPDRRGKRQCQATTPLLRAKAMLAATIAAAINARNSSERCRRVFSIFARRASCSSSLMVFHASKAGNLGVDPSIGSPRPQRISVIVRDVSSPGLHLPHRWPGSHYRRARPISSRQCIPATCVSSAATRACSSAMSSFSWAISCATAASAPESFSSALAIPRSVAVATI